MVDDTSRHTAQPWLEENIVEPVQEAAEAVTDAVGDAAEAVGDAAEATVDFVEEHKAEIAGIVAGIAVTAGCLVVTGGAGSIGCAALGGAVGAGLTGYMNGQRGWELVGTVALGAAAGALGGAAGSLAARDVGVLASRLTASRAGGALARVGDFASTRSAFQHYAKHAKGIVLGPKGSASHKSGGPDMPEFASFAAYRSAARQFMGGGAPRGTLEGIRPGGDLVRVDPKSGFFGVRASGGTIRTFFRPDNPLQYFMNQF